MKTSPELVGDAGAEICAFLTRTGLTFESAPELFRALAHIHIALENVHVTLAMNQKQDMAQFGDVTHH